MFPSSRTSKQLASIRMHLHMHYQGTALFWRNEEFEEKTMHYITVLLISLLLIHPSSLLWLQLVYHLAQHELQIMPPKEIKQPLLLPSVIHLSSVIKGKVAQRIQVLVRRDNSGHKSPGIRGESHVFLHPGK